MTDCENITFGKSYQGTIEDSDDEDCYLLQVDKGDVCEVTLEKEVLEDVRIDIAWPGGFSTLYNESAETLERKITIEDNGNVELTTYTSDEGPYDYTLEPSSNPGADEWPGDESHEVGFGDTYSGTIHSPDDEDPLKFQVGEGDVCTLTLDKAVLEDVRIDIDWPGGFSTL